jgi:hypothetical protein
MLLPIRTKNGDYQVTQKSTSITFMGDLIYIFPTDLTLSAQPDERRSGSPHLFGRSFSRRRSRMGLNAHPRGRRRCVVDWNNLVGNSGDPLDTSTSVGAELRLFCCSKKFPSSILGTDVTGNRCATGIQSLDETQASFLRP